MATFTTLFLCPFSNLPKTPPVFPKTPTFFLKSVQNPRNTPVFSTFREMGTTPYYLNKYTNYTTFLCNKVVTSPLNPKNKLCENVSISVGLVND